MTKIKSYGGLDYVRVLAAILVIAIHTSPLSSYSPLSDFILTRVLARVAVPFFIMTTGFFMYKENGIKKATLHRFLIKTLKLYGVVILLYVPLNIYMDYFKKDNLLLTIVKDVLFNGTLYHLWYLPGILLGAVLSFYFIKKLDITFGIIVSLILYIIGLLGDSYYGLALKVPVLDSFYSYVFQIFDYTRNGLFYVPVFFIMGVAIRRKMKSYSIRLLVIGFVGSLSAMIVEGLILHNYNLQYHDSMYIFLLPTMYFLFSMLTVIKIPSVPALRDISTIMYIIHPLVIVTIRVVAKFIKLEKYLIENSLIHFIAVMLFSMIGATTLVVLFKIIKVRRIDSHNIEQQYTQSHDIDQRDTDNLVIESNGYCSITDEQMILNDRAWIEVNLENLRHNVSALKNIMQKHCDLMAVVKADAYGHGAIKVASCLNEMGINDFAVAALEEGIALRKAGIIGQILVLGYTDPSRFYDLYEYKITQTVVDYSYGIKLAEFKHKISVHIKIDTGMHRLGISCNEVDNVIRLFGYKTLDIRGIYTHLCVAETDSKEDVDFTFKQIVNFYDLLDKLKANGITLPKVHIQSSYGLLNYPELSCDYVRLGIALYGTLSSDDETRLNPNLRPVLSLKARVSIVRELNKGESMGYGLAYTADANVKIAGLSIGYADGISRNMIEESYVLLHGKRCKIVGRICMDQLMVDVTHLEFIQEGDIATLIGRDGLESITPVEVAKQSGTITNELLSRLGTRLQRIYID